MTDAALQPSAVVTLSAHMQSLAAATPELPPLPASNMFAACARVEEEEEVVRRLTVQGPDIQDVGEAV